MNPVTKKRKLNSTNNVRECLMDSTMSIGNECEDMLLQDDGELEDKDFSFGDANVTAEEDLLLLSPEEDEEDSLDFLLDDILGEKRESPIGVKTRLMLNLGSLPSTDDEEVIRSESQVCIDLPKVKPVTQDVKQHMNPLTIPLLLDNVMMFLGTNDLKNCRLVNFQWNRSSVSHLKINHPPIALTKPSQMFHFNRVMKTAKEFPYTNFKFRSRFTSRVEKYFQTFGLEITSIEILSTHGKSFIDFSNVFKLIKTMPNLKKLSLINVEFQKSETPDLEPTPLVMKHLESLTFTGWYVSRSTISLAPLSEREQDCISYFYNSTPHLKHLQLNILRATIVQNFLNELSQLKELQSLNVHSIVETDLKLLIKASNDLPSLKSLTLKEVHMTHHGETLLKVMETYTTRLEYLVIRVLTTRGIRIVKFPEMKALKLLQLETFFATDSFILDDFFESSNPFPALKKLMVTQTVLHGMMIANFKSTSVTELVLKMNPIPDNGFRNAIQDDDEPENHSRYNPNQVDMISKINDTFPMLKKFKVMDARCSALRYIFTTLTTLEELEINHAIQRYGVCSTIYLNQTLTGLSCCVWLSRMYENYKGLSPLKEHQQIVIDFIRSISPISIRNMKNLKVLILNGRQSIDDSTVQFALLHLQPLERLVFTDKSIGFGDHMLELLRKRHKIVQILKTESPTDDTFFNLGL